MTGKIAVSLNNAAVNFSQVSRWRHFTTQEGRHKETRSIFASPVKTMFTYDPMSLCG